MHQKKVKHTRITMDKKRLRISLKVLEAVKERFPDTKNCIDNMMEEQCQDICGRGNFTSQKAKS